ncbi:type I-E CRISPR-associated protein Cse1/CasA [Streptomyces sp. NPDC001698]|uniref:type I-E CRISPR-associated protein Cse1/CasA n=1 Tax=Streptomyces sp. NPDC001698 TaxID=3364601 RepID=UPI0036ACC313
MPETDQNSGSDGVLSFDLTARPWIPVLRVDGGQGELSLREVFEQANGLRRIVGDLPTQEFALVRLLLAIAHDTLDGPQDTDAWAELWADENCFAPVGAYLEAHRGRFDLLDPQVPFFQTAVLRTAQDEVFSLNRIVADVPNGEPFFTARMPTVERLTFAEAARWVVHAHAYDTSGIKTGVEGDERVKGGKVYPLGVGWAGSLGGVFVEGRTLRETLLLNLVAADTSNLEIDEADAPAWRREPSGPGGAERAPTGVRDLYTWQTRRLRLHFDATGVHGVVLGYGDPLTPRDRQHREPMTAWRRSKPQEKKLRKSPVYLPREHDPERSAWRGLGALVATEAEKAQGSEPADYLRPGILEWVARLVTEGELERGFLVRARIVGARYGTQQSVIDEIVDDHVAMAVVLLHQQDRRYAEQAVAAVGDADLAVNALGDLATNLARAAGTETEGPRSSARDLAYGLLEAPYRTWLAHLAKADDPYAQRTAWQQQVYGIVGKLGDRLMAAAGDAAWQGRIVQLKHGTEWLNSALAGKWFRAALHKGLGRPDSFDMPPDADTSPAPETTVKAPA